MIAWFARNDVAANLLMVSVLLLGVHSLLNEVAVEVFPTTDPDIVTGHRTPAAGNALVTTPLGQISSGTPVRVVKPGPGAAADAAGGAE